jgi:hypothetical protein
MIGRRGGLLVAGALLAACSAKPGGNGAGSADSGAPDGSTSSSDAGPPAWSTPAAIDTNTSSGFDLTAAVDPSGHAAVAYWTETDTSMEYFEPVIARDDGHGNWTQEVISIPASQSDLASVPELTGHYGMALAFDSQGNPWIAFLGGGNADLKTMGDGRWTNFDTGQPLPSSAVLMNKVGGTWNSTTVAEYSNSIVTTGFMVDDEGVVTGLWAGLALDEMGTVHAFYRDIHFGSDMSATSVSNLEYYEQSASGTKLNGELVAGGRGDPDMLQGAGQYTRALLANGLPSVAYSLSSMDTSSVEGVWFSQRTGNATDTTLPDGGPNDGATNWTRVNLTMDDGEVGDGPSIAWQSGQGFAVGFYDLPSTMNSGVLKVFTSPDGTTWTPNTWEALGDTGHYPSVAFDTSGNLGVLYGYCRAPTDSTDGCSPNQELRFRLNVDDEEHVDSRMPSATALVVDGSGRFIAIYKVPGGGLMFATRTP